MAKLINTVRKHLVIDCKDGNAFTLDGVNPTRFDGRWVQVKKAARLALVESAVCLFLDVKSKVNAEAEEYIAEDRNCYTYRERLVQKLGDVLSHGGEGRDSLLKETRSILTALEAQTGRTKAKAGDKAASKPQKATKATGKGKGKATKPATAQKASAKGKTNAAGKKEVVSEASSLRDLDELRRELEEKVRDSRASEPAERKARLKTARKIPCKRAVKSYEFRRNPDVIVEVLERTGGTCEACGKPAPFRRASNDEPYLEVHHKKPLSQGGEDTVENATALCPNCHRKRHYGTQQD